jgi:metal-sulfur cluster biosynthetic enzyme
MSSSPSPIESGDAYPYTGPEEARAPIEAALRQVVDPEIGMSILDVGLVYGVDLTAAHCLVQLTMTSAACPLGDMIVAEVEEALAAVLQPGVAIDVALVFDPPWTPDRMSDRARQMMRW